MRAAFLSPIARPSLRLKLEITPAGHQYLAWFAELSNGPRPSGVPFPFASHRTLAEVAAEEAVAACQ